MSKTIAISAAGLARNFMKQHLAGRTQIHEHLLRHPDLHGHLLGNRKLANDLTDELEDLDLALDHELEVEVEKSDVIGWILEGL